MEATKDRNYIFYVSDMEELPRTGHFRKMDAEREIVEQIRKGLGDCKIKRYTEYDGEVISADSIGIVFPAHMWGVSLAVYAFLHNLKFLKNTYVYAVAVGDSLSGCVRETTSRRLKILDQFKSIFAKKNVGVDTDIFIRCIDMKREIAYTEINLRAGKDVREKVSCIMSGLLFLSEREIENRAVCADEVLEKDSNIPPIMESFQNTRSKKTLTNIYLDDSTFAGVRLCRVI